MKRKTKQGNFRSGCLGLLLLIGTCTLISQIPTPEQAQPPAPLALAPRVDTPARLPTATTEPTATPPPLPTDTPAPLPTDTPLPLPTDTPLPLPTNTPLPLPTATPLPTDTPLPLPPPTEPPAAALANSGGSEQPFVCNGGCTEPPAGSTCQIKGNVNSKGDHIYHVPGWRDYERTNVKPEEGDRWFCTEEEASAAGFRAPKNR